FEDLYLRTYHFSLTSDHDNENIVNTENDTSIFENHIDDFFEYATNQTWISKNDLLFEWKHNKDWLPNLSAMAQNFLAVPATSTASEQIFSCADIPEISKENMSDIDNNKDEDNCLTNKNTTLSEKNFCKRP
ncbi:9922_t:CDS:2, partial [Gigaspora margarita]